MNNEHLYQVVGLLRSNWLDKSGKLILFNYGTAFAISKYILITCTHNIYSDKFHSYASQVIFIPNLSQQRITARTQKYKAFKGKNYRSLIPQTLNNRQPIKEELALVLLNEPLQTQVFLQIGYIQQDQKANEMRVIGYPSQNYMDSKQLINIKIQRHQAVGELYLKHIPTTHILSYTMPTSVGVSGSLILIKDSHSNYKIAGVHTHRGLSKEYNSGLYFDKKTLHTIQEWAKQLEQEFKKKNNFFIQSYFKIRECGLGLKLDNSQMQELDSHSYFQQSKRLQNDDLTYDGQCYSDVEQDQGQYQNKSALEGDYDLFEEFYYQSRQISPESQTSSFQTAKNYITSQKFLHQRIQLLSILLLTLSCMIFILFNQISSRILLNILLLLSKRSDPKIIFQMIFIEELKIQNNKHHYSKSISKQ